MFNVRLLTSCVTFAPVIEVSRGDRLKPGLRTSQTENCWSANRFRPKKFVCVALRNSVTEEIIALTLSPHDLSEKAGIPLLRAQEIFEAALRAADQTP